MGKIQIKRPFFILFVVVNYALAPGVHFLFIRHMETSLGFNSWQVFGNYQLYSMPLILAMPLVALGLFLLRRWGFYLFGIHAALIFADNIYRSIYYPKIYAIIMLVVSAILLVLVVALVMKHFRSPYLQILKRNRRENERLPIYHSGLVNDQVFVFTDLSVGGCYIESKQHSFQLDDPVIVNFNSENLVINAHGKVLRIDEKGFGIQFRSLSPIEKQSIRLLLMNRFELRYKINLEGRVNIDGHESNAILLNISRNGGYICLEDLNGVVTEKKVTLVTRFFTLHGKVSWVNEKAEYQKPKGFGVHFDKKIRNVVGLIQNCQIPIETTR